MKIKVVNVQRAISSIDEMLKSENPNKFKSYRRMGRSDLGKKEHFVFASTEEAEKHGVENLKEQVSKVTDLLKLRFTLRGLVDEFNQKSAVSANMLKIAEIEDLVLHYNTMLEDNASAGFNATNNMFSSGISDGYKKELQASVRKFKLEIKKLKDHNSALNASEEIELPEGVAHELKGLELLG